MMTAAHYLYSTKALNNGLFLLFISLKHTQTHTQTHTDTHRDTHKQAGSNETPTRTHKLRCRPGREGHNEMKL